MSALTIRRCSCADILENPAWPEVQKAYADEVRYPDLPADLDYLMYLRLETAGVLKIVGGVDAEGSRGRLQLPRVSAPPLCREVACVVGKPVGRSGAPGRFFRAVHPRGGALREARNLQTRRLIQ